MVDSLNELISVKNNEKLIVSKKERKETVNLEDVQFANLLENEKKSDSIEPIVNKEQQKENQVADKKDEIIKFNLDLTQFDTIQNKTLKHNNLVTKENQHLLSETKKNISEKHKTVSLKTNPIPENQVENIDLFAKSKIVINNHISGVNQKSIYSKIEGFLPDNKLKNTTENYELKTNVKNKKNEITNKHVEANLLTEKKIKKEIQQEKFNPINQNKEHLTKTDNKNTVENQLQSNMSKNKSVISQIVKNKDNSKTLEPETKEFKSELKLEINDLKNTNSQVTKNIAAENHKILNDNKEVIFEHIAKNTKIILGNEETKFSTMIRPDNFGRMDLKFAVKDGKIDGRIILQNQEAVDFFRNNVEQLKAVFQKSDVELGNVDIILAGNNFGQGPDQQSSNFSKENNNNFENLYSKAQNAFEENNVSGVVYNSQFTNSNVNIFI